MDLKMRTRLKAVLRLLILGVGILLLPANSPADSNPFEDFNFDDCDPFLARARIMDINGKRAQLVAAEQTIYVVDWHLGDQRLTTELSDADGNPMDFGSLRQGQWIRVKGFKHVDGGVVASSVQRIKPPQRDIPVVRKIRKENRHSKRIKRGLELRNQ